MESVFPWARESSELGRGRISPINFSFFRLYKICDKIFKNISLGQPSWLPWKSEYQDIINKLGGSIIKEGLYHTRKRKKRKI